jgi:membrane-associated phospholipid phosphatase
MKGRNVQLPIDVTTSHTSGKGLAPARAIRAFLAALVVVGPGLSAPCFAAPSYGHVLIEDSKLYFTAPLRWNARDWLYFGGTLAAIGVAHEYDDNVRAHFANSTGATLDRQDRHSLRDAAPAAAVVFGTWAFAALKNDSAGYEEGREMLEAAGLTAVSTTLFKFAAGRKRPNETLRVDEWGQGGDSFPSMHASLAFAIGTVLAESGNDEYRWVRRVLGYGIAGATAYARLHGNVHWFSDTVAGAALGIATAHFVLNRGDARDAQSAFTAAPVDGGVMLAYRHALH